MRERRICTLCHGDRCIVVNVQRVTMCPRCNGDGVELLELAKPLAPRARQLVIWYQLELPLDASPSPRGDGRVRESAHEPDDSLGHDDTRERRTAVMADLTPAARSGGADPAPFSKAALGGSPGAAVGNGPRGGGK
jgi:hypothetical protein